MKELTDIEAENEVWRRIGIGVKCGIYGLAFITVCVFAIYGLTQLFPNIFKS